MNKEKRFHLIVKKSKKKLKKRYWFQIKYPNGKILNASQRYRRKIDAKHPRTQLIGAMLRGLYDCVDE